MLRTTIVLALLALVAVVQPAAAQQDTATQQARAFLKSRQPDQAIAAFTRLLQDRGAQTVQRVDWLHGRAQAHALKNDNAAAIRDIDEAIRLNAAEPAQLSELYFFRSRIYHEGRRLQQALDDVNAALGADPAAPQPRQATLFATRGGIHAEMGNMAAAIPDLEGAIGIGQGVPASIRTAWHLSLARAYRQSGQRDRALAELTQAVALAPKQPEIYIERGDAYLLAGDAARAAADYEASIRLAPSTVAASRLAWARADQRNFGAAADLAGKAVQLAPNEPTGYWDRGAFLFFQGKFRESAADFERVAQMEPGNVSAVLWAHLARTRAGMTDTATLASQAGGLNLREWPGPLVQLMLGKLQPQQVLDAARTQDAEQQRKRLCEAYFFAGQYHLLRNEKSQANTMFRKAVETDVRQYVEYAAANAELARGGK